LGKLTVDEKVEYSAATKDIRMVEKKAMTMAKSTVAMLVVMKDEILVVLMVAHWERELAAVKVIEKVGW